LVKIWSIYQSPESLKVSLTASTVDHATLEHLVQAGAIRGAHVVGQAGGWGVVVQYGATERALAAKRGTVRIFRKFETLAGYLKNIGILQYQVDAREYDPVALKIERSRSDASNRMKDAHEAVAYRNWLEDKVNATRAALADGSKKHIAPKDWDEIRAAKLKQKQQLTA
jgi:hypothetical protein